MIKSKKWLISVGLAVVLVLSFTLPACTGDGGGGEPGERISFAISSPPGHYAEAAMIAEDLQDFGLDVSAPPMDSSTFFDLLYHPNTDGAMEAFIWADDPAPEPWSDWIWCYYADPWYWGYEWNPCWYDVPEFDELYFENYLVTDLEEKAEIINEMQLMIAEDIPNIFLMREDIIAACRTDRWDNWFLEMGGYATWINEYSIREVTPKTDDTRLNIGVTAMPNNLYMDQLDLQNTNMGTLYLLLVYEPLYCYPKIDEDIGDAYNFAPRLVKDYTWSYEPDGNGGENQILTLELRDDVKWHDGVNFTADDVVYSFKSKVVSPWAPDHPINWTNVNSDEYSWCDDDICPKDILVEKDGDYTVKFTYVEGYHQPEAYLPCDPLWYAIVPEHVFGSEGEGEYENWNEDPTAWDGEYIGTGPYKVKEYEVDQYIWLERNDEYYGDLPAAEEVLFRLYDDENAMWMAFESDDPNSLVDLAIAGVPYQKKASYEDDERITVKVVPDLSILTLGFNLNTTYGSPYLSDMVEDLPLREAIAAAINKTKLCDMIAGGYAEPADSWVYLESEYHYGGADNYGVLPNNEYDLTKAEQILLDAGYTKDDDGYWCLPE